MSGPYFEQQMAKARRAAPWIVAAGVGILVAVPLLVLLGACPWWMWPVGWLSGSIPTFMGVATITDERRRRRPRRGRTWEDHPRPPLRGNHKESGDLQ